MSSNPPASTAVVITAPTTRIDGSALALSAIASVVLSKAAGTGAPAVIATWDTLGTNPAPAATMSFTDNSPDAGETDNYSAVVTDTEGNVSAAGTASVVVPPSTLAAPSAPTVTATYTA
jgi:hypothetical protein